MSGDARDPVLTLAAKFEGLRASMHALESRVDAQTAVLTRMPEQMGPVIESAVLRGLQSHQVQCPAMIAFPHMLEQVGEGRGRLNEITQTIRVPKSDAIRVSIPPSFIKSPLIRWIAGIILGIVLAALGVSGATYSGEEAADTDSTPASLPVAAHP